MKTIYKYVFDGKSMIQEFDMPSSAIPLCVQMQGNNICMWCDVKTDNPIVKRKFCIVGTGHEKPDGLGTYIGSVFPHPFVFHIYIADNL